MKFATGNDNKLAEARSILGFPIEKAEVGDLDEIQTVDVMELIRHKAKSAFEIAGEPVIVEDTGLHFKAWNGLPGALVKWFMTSVGNEGLLRMLETYPDRRADAVSVVASYDGTDFTISEGRLSGSIATSPRGTNGFSWDKIFVPEGRTKTFAEMTSAEKNEISMRTKAFLGFKKIIGQK